jgi:hypothetical protein
LGARTSERQSSSRSEGRGIARCHYGENGLPTRYSKWSEARIRNLGCCAEVDVGRDSEGTAAQEVQERLNGAIVEIGNRLWSRLDPLSCS